MSNTFQHIHVIINPSSGQDEPILNTLNTIFNELDAYWTVSITHKYGDGKTLARQAIENGADLIVAYGGDGTIVDVVNGVVGSDVPMAVLPGGTGNGIMKELGIPLTLAEAARSIFEFPIETIDVGYTEQTYYLLRLDLGIIADVVSGTTREMKDRWGAMAYLMNTATHITRPARTYTLKLDDEEVTIEGIGCVVTNANKIGALQLGFNEKTKINDGKLDIIVMTDIGTILQNVATSLIQLNNNVAVNLHHWQSKSVTIQTQEPQQVLADGEAIGETPISTEIHTQALRVIKNSSKD